MWAAECPGQGAGQCWTQAPNRGHMKTEATLVYPQKKESEGTEYVPPHTLFSSIYLFACLLLRQSHDTTRYTCLYACLCLLSAWIKGMYHHAPPAGMTSTCHQGQPFLCTARLRVGEVSLKSSAAVHSTETRAPWVPGCPPYCAPGRA